MTDASASHASLLGLSDGFRDGALRPSAVTEAHLDRIARLDGTTGAYMAVYADEAREAAHAADRALAAGHRIGPLHGIPFALKDIIDVEGRITTGGSLALKDRVSPSTAPVARRLLSGGGVLLGKTKTVELAYGAWGTNTRTGTPWNPWDRRIHRVCGGSSSGNGAALAAGMTVCAVGTDTGGSVRMPAGFCGLTALKVTEGRLSTEGILPLSHTLDTPGPMARSVGDALLMYQVLAGREGWQIDRERAERTGLWGVLEQGVRGLRLGTIGENERACCTPDVLAAYDAALETLRGLGAEVELFEPPVAYDAMREENGRIISIEGWFHHGHLYGDPDLPMDEDVRPRFLAGRGVTADEYLRLLADRRAIQARFAEAMRGYAALLTPVTMTAAPPVTEVDQSIAPGYFTRIHNFLGMCALALPMGLNPEGLPLGLQIAARGGDEATALRVGAAFEATQPPLPWPTG